jgi:hypothetical protein
MESNCREKLSLLVLRAFMDSLATLGLQCFGRNLFENYASILRNFNGIGYPEQTAEKKEKLNEPEKSS